MLARRTPLRRGGFIKRGGPVKAKRAAPRRSSYFEDRPYLAWVRTRRCAIARRLGTDPRTCSAWIQPDHLRAGAGAGQRSPDPCAYPACATHHAHQHGMNGVFAGWDRSDIDALCAELAAESQAGWYGRALTAGDLPIVRAVLEDGRSTRGLFGPPADAAF